MVLRRIKGLLIVCVVAMSVTAMPPRREGVLRTAADGTEKMVYQRGNGLFHYLIDEQGNILDEETLQPLDKEAAEAMRAQEAHVRRIAQQKKVGGEPNLAPRGLFIMVNFRNQKFVTPHDTVDSMMNGANYTRRYDYEYEYKGKTYKGTITSKGSARKYFQDQSYGQYNPVFDVVGPYTLSQNYEYYGKNYGGGGTDSNVGEMIKEACQLADADGADFTLYDNDNDGNVDFVYVLYAGEGEADGGNANTIWPHNHRLTYTYSNFRVDGKRVDNYACSNEINHYGGSYAGIGTLVHEFCHVIGLPDLYVTDTDNPDHTTLNEWDILDYGPYSNDGNTPPGFSAYERFYCGWLTPRVLTAPENVRLKPIDEQEALIICTGDKHNLVGYDPNPTTFYLLEARNRKGWDEYLPGNGMLITKIAYSAYKWGQNMVNNDGNNMGVDIIEARANSSGWGAPTDAYPAGATGWTGLAGHEVSSIVRNAQDGSVSFLYKGGNGIEDVQGDNIPCTKVLREGQVYLMYNGQMYDVQGKRIEN